MQLESVNQLDFLMTRGGSDYGEKSFSTEKVGQAI